MGLLDEDYDETTAPPRLRGLYRDLAPDPGAEYGTVLPFARDKATGEKRWAMPSLVRDGLLGGLDLMAGTETGDVTPRGAMTLLGGGPASAAAAPAGATFGIFGGKGAATANLDALRRAQFMKGLRKSPDRIYGDTGWFTGPDRKWRFEINDQDAGLNKFQGINYLDDLLNHEALYKAYPEMRGVRVEVSQMGPTRAVAYPQLHRIDVNPDVIGDPKFKETMLHEAQHMVQGLENFAPGGGPSDRLGKMLPPDWRGSASGGSLAGTSSPQYEAYHRLIGETEARNAATRADMSRPDRIYRPPWETEDVPRKLQLKDTWEQALGVPAPGIKRTRRSLVDRGW